MYFKLGVQGPLVDTSRRNPKADVVLQSLQLCVQMRSTVHPLTIVCVCMCIYIYIYLCVFVYFVLCLRLYAPLCVCRTLGPIRMDPCSASHNPKVEGSVCASQRCKGHDIPQTWAIYSPSGAESQIAGMRARARMIQLNEHATTHAYMHTSARTPHTPALAPN